MINYFNFFQMYCIQPTRNLWPLRCNKLYCCWNINCIILLFPTSSSSCKNNDVDHCEATLERGQFCYIVIFHEVYDAIIVENASDAK